MTDLAFNRQIYEILVQDALTAVSESVEKEGLKRISVAAEFAATCYPGILSDYRLEVELNRIGLECFDPLTPRQSSSDRRRVLHIATSLYNTGGHTRVLRSWMNLDSESDSYLFLTNQSSELSQTMWRSFARSCKGVIYSQERDVFRSVRRVRAAIASIRPDLIVLHHHPYDIVPIVALSTPQLPPILLYNHSDHTFGLGPSVADLYVDLRNAGSALSISKRLAKRSEILPFPLQAPDRIIERATAKYSLGIPSSATVLLTMAALYKFTPLDDVDFVGFFRGLLSARPSVHLFIVGVAPTDERIVGKQPLPANIHCMGRMEDPSVLLASADYFIEPWPLPTFLGAYDSMLRGAFPILSFAPVEICGGGLATILPSDLKSATSQTLEGYANLLLQEIETRKLATTLGSVLDEYMQSCMKSKWQVRLEQVYAAIESASHEIGMAHRLEYLDDTNSLLYAKLTNTTVNPIRELRRLELKYQSPSMASLAKKCFRSYSPNVVWKSAKEAWRRAKAIRRSLEGLSHFFSM